jgi:16S rRNA (cytosine1402-N4)-methyltransferase
MAEEVVALLQPRSKGIYCDATVGGGGHARVILEHSAPEGQLYAIDQDPEALAFARERLSAFGRRAIFARGNFSELPEMLHRLDAPLLDGLLVDLGVSSHQLDSAGRGFSFAKAGPIDMRMDPESGETALALITRSSVGELAALIRRYGEERRAKAVAQAIKLAQEGSRLHTTLDLARVVGAALSGGGRPTRIHPATRTFMALRMAVNQELESLSSLLDVALDLLRIGGRLAIIAFHSLEDRAVKSRFAKLADPCTCPPQLPICACGRKPSVRLVSKKAIKASETEQAQNPRSRSARLRAVERIV